ncbi:MAG: DUF4349 domain-containing protein [Chloroflexi bacterium]|nr:DUF4349 domain-containing protein [Chloroflexota bacterium]
MRHTFGVFVLCLSLAGIVLLSGCGASSGSGGNTSNRDSYSVPPAAPAPLPAQGSKPAAQPGAGTAAGQAEAGLPSMADRKIISTVDLNLVVADTQATFDAVSKLTNEAGGFIANSQLRRDNEALYANMTIRIPADDLPRTLESLKKLAVRVDSEAMRSEEVTQEYVDLNARLTNMEATEVELRQLLTEVRQRTQKAEDIMAVYRELTSVRGEIEQIKGRMQMLDQLTSLATINLQLTPDIAGKSLPQEGWRPLVVARTALLDLAQTLQFLGSFAIRLLFFYIPILIIIALPLAIIVLIVRRWARGRRPQPVTPSAGSEA